MKKLILALSALLLIGNLYAIGHLSVLSSYPENLSNLNESATELEENHIQIFLKLDSSPEDIQWTITNSLNELMLNSPSYASYSPGTTINVSEYLPDDCYNFWIIDAGGNGLEAGHYYSVKFNGETVASGWDFTTYELTTFCVDANQTYDCIEVEGSGYLETFESSINCSTSSSQCNVSCYLENGWINESSDDINWRVHSGETPSYGTGPTTSTGDYSGKYLYLEASSGCTDKKAILTSPCFDTSDATFPVLVFGYHMHGANIGKISIATSVNDGPWTYKHSLYGTNPSGNVWGERIHIIPQSTNVRVRVIGTTGSGWNMDIAIDGIRVYDYDNYRLPSSSTISDFIEQDLKFTLSPNPTNDNFTVDILSKTSDYVQLEIISMNGQIIHSQTIEDEYEISRININAQDFQSGIYMVKVTSAGYSSLEKIMINLGIVELWMP